MVRLCLLRAFVPTVDCDFPGPNVAVRLCSRRHRLAVESRPGCLQSRSSNVGPGLRKSDRDSNDGVSRLRASPSVAVPAGRNRQSAALYSYRRKLLTVAESPSFYLAPIRLCLKV